MTVPVASARSRTCWIAVRGGALQGTVTSTSIRVLDKYFSVSVTVRPVRHIWWCPCFSSVPFPTVVPTPEQVGHVVAFPSTARFFLPAARMHPTGAGSGSSRSSSRIRTSAWLVRIALDPTGKLARLPASQRAVGLGTSRCASASIQSW